MNVFGTILGIAIIGVACYLIYKNGKAIYEKHKAKKKEKEIQQSNNSKESK